MMTTSKAVETLKQYLTCQNAEDCIGRRCSECEHNFSDGDFVEAIGKAVEALSWIPVSERLPELDEDGYSNLVLVSFANSSIPAILEYRKDSNDWYDQTEPDGAEGASGIGLVVNAWMPLPECYLEEKS